MNFAENFRNNRKRLGYTQDEISKLLMVTPQAVSKWENGLGTPDISLIVPIAKIFGITTDELLGSVIKDREELRIELAETSVENINYSEKYNKFLEFLKQYPNSTDVLARLIRCTAEWLSRDYEKLSDEDRNELVIKSEGFADRIRAQVGEVGDHIYSHAYMADVYISAKEYEKARHEIDHLPYARYNKARMLGNLNSIEGNLEEAIEQYRESISDGLYWLFWDIERLARCDYKLSGINEYAISVMKLCYNMIHLLYGENRYPIPLIHSLIDCNIQLAAHYTRIGDYDRSYKHLDEYIELHEAYNESYGRIFETGCILFPKAMQPFNQYGVHNKKNYKDWVLRRLGWNSFEVIKNDERYQQLLSRVNSWE